MKKIRLFLTGLLLVVAATMYAQNLQVTGTVTDAATGDVVPFASIQIKGTSSGTNTDDRGNYTISVPADGTLVFSFIGYKTVEKPINNRSIINVSISLDATALDEVLVIAYGTAKKESFTGSAEVITSAEIERRTVSNVSKALDGLATGVVSLGGSGQPGAGSEIRIRGFGSLNASSDPLYVVDGVPYEGNVNAINPNDIESMTIIKDASAGALYGARGANGVIMINTKRGQEGKLSVNVKANWGFGSRAVPRYDTMNATEWVEDLFNTLRHPYIAAGSPIEEAGREALAELAGSAIFGKDEEYNPFSKKVGELIDVSTGKMVTGVTQKWDEDWLDAATENAPLRQEYLLSVSGGDTRTKYMFSLGYLDQEGLIKSTSFDRFSGRANIDSKITKWLKAGLNISLASTKSNTTTLKSTNDSNSYYSNVFYSAQNMAPIYPVYVKDADGKTVYEDGKALYDWGSNRPDGASADWHPVALLEEDKYNLASDNVSGRTYIDLLDLKKGPIQGLKFSANFGFDYVNSKESTYNNPHYGNATGTNGYISNTNRRYFSYTFNQLVTYQRKFGKHDIDFLAGHEYFNRNYQYLNANKTGVVSEGIYELDGFVTIGGVGGYSKDYSIDSYLGRFNYGYDDKYYVSASYRRDASSRFHPDNRWGNFWSVGASWRISEENFMKGVDWINNLTLKASYGVQGNDDILDDDDISIYYAWQQMYDLGYNNTSLGGVIVSSLETKDLKWERNNNLNVGIEARLFDRLSISAEYYNRVTNDMLMNFPIAFSLGFDGYNANVGNMKNSGFELSLTGDIIRNDKFYWGMTLMASTIKNKITKLTADNNEIKGTNYIQKVGYAIDSYYLTESAGVDPETGDQLYWIWPEDPTTGEEVRETTNSYSTATSYRKVTGSRTPAVYGSWANNFQIGNFDVSILATYSLGGKILDDMYYSYLFNLYDGVTGHVDRKDAWQMPGDITDIPRIDIGGADKINRTDKDLISASYLALKNVTVGYTLPRKWTEKISIQALRVFATGDNLLLLSARKGLNPQYNFSGSTGYAYTPERTISFGIDITF